MHVIGSWSPSLRTTRVMGVESTTSPAQRLVSGAYDHPVCEVAFWECCAEPAELTEEDRGWIEHP